ncbi:MAG: TonB-dependent receptor, partial [candidate division Zixibacteria bacterium]|nr:TonB-dependent receptor [candidate division Zixibacteria bacterium]
EIETRNPSDLAELLQSLPGVAVQRSGGPVDPVRVSIRGSASRHVLVLVDGQRVNSSADGESDLSVVPVQAVQRIEVHRGGSSAQFGPNALGGVINIITDVGRGLERSVSVDRRAGSWADDFRSVSLANAIPVDSVVTRFFWSRQSSNGDYPFSYSVQPVGNEVSGIRINNDAGRSSYHLAAQYRPKAHMLLKFTGQLSETERGLPGNAPDQNLQARAEDDRTIVGGIWQIRPSERLSGEIQVGYTRYRQYMVDTVITPSVNRFHTEYDNRILTAGARSDWHPWDGQTVGVSWQVRNEWLDHDDLMPNRTGTGHTSRVDYGMGVSTLQRLRLPSWLVFDQLTADVALRWDRAHTEHDSTGIQDSVNYVSSEFWSPKAGVAMSCGDNTRLTVRSSYGKSVSLPAINALFWKPDARSSGNPRLRPERSEHSEAGVELSTGWRGHRVRMGATYFHSYVSDLVVWQAGRGGVWKPVNLAAARTTGHEDFVVLAFADDLLQVEYQNTVTSALNREPGLNSYGKRLTFTPHYQTAYSIRFNHSHAFLDYSVRLVDIRYANASNDKWYEAYRVDDLRLGARLSHGRWRLEGEYKVCNMRGEHYTLINHYPMPPREWQIGASLTYDIVP